MAKKKTPKTPKGTKPNQKTTATAETIKKTSARRQTEAYRNDGVMVFNKENFKWVGIGVALIGLGMLLMIGGFNEDPSIWDESKIYGFQRTVLAPIMILAGLGVQIYAIFK